MITAYIVVTVGAIVANAFMATAHFMRAGFVLNIVDENKGERDYPRLYVSAADEVVNALQQATDMLACPLPSDLSAG